MDPLKRLETDAKVNTALDAWELLRTQHRELPAQAVSVLLYVASHNNCHKQAIEEDIGITPASCSRSIDFLCEKNRLNKRGLGLIEKYIDGSSRRRYLLKMTPKGEVLIRHFKSILYG